MAENRDVIEYLLATLWRHRRASTTKLTRFETTNVTINSYNFEAKLMRLSDDIHNCLTEIVDVFQ